MLDLTGEDNFWDRRILPTSRQMCPTVIKDEYKNAVSDALQRCTPLSFSCELGGSIAGVPLFQSLMNAV